MIVSVNDFVKDRQFVRLNNTTRDENLPVLRGKSGSMQQVNIWELVVGDVVALKAGDRVPADCIIIDSVNVHTNEAHFTGEDTPVKKSTEADPFLLTDTFLVSGACRVLVCCVGEFSKRITFESTLDTRI